VIESVRVAPTTVIVDAVTAVTLPAAPTPNPPRAKPPDGVPLGKAPEGAPLGGAPAPFSPPKARLQVPLTGWVITTVAAVMLVTRTRGLADGAALGAAEPEAALRAGMANTHPPTTTAAFVVVAVWVKAVLGL
jgi:hypothetical protein